HGAFRFGRGAPGGRRKAPGPEPESRKRTTAVSPLLREFWRSPGNPDRWRPRPSRATAADVPGAPEPTSTTTANTLARHSPLRAQARASRTRSQPPSSRQKPRSTRATEPVAAARHFGRARRSSYRAVWAGRAPVPSLDAARSKLLLP